jgi:(S)-2-hydroxy-acid oxidase
MNRTMELVTNVSEYEKLAKERLSKMVHDYYASRVEDRWPLKKTETFSRIL